MLTGHQLLPYYKLSSLGDPKNTFGSLCFFEEKKKKIIRWSEWPSDHLLCFFELFSFFIYFYYFLFFYPSNFVHSISH